jgi:putative ABC transport system permease protein
LGQDIRLGEDEVYQVTGVMADIPQPSHLPSHPMLFSMKTRTIEGADYWVGRSNIASYLLLREGANLVEVQRLADEVYLNHAREIMAAVNADCRITLQPLKDIHFDTTFDFTFDYQPVISYQKILVFSLLAVFILVIAAIGFINMTTARSGERARQVGICKAVGASRRWLIGRFLGESILTSLAAMVLALVLVQLFLPVFSGFVSRQLSFDLSRDLNLVGIFLLLSVGVGLLAGLYPAFVLSSFAAGETMRGNVIPGTRRARLRSALIVFQFAISILLVICTLTVNHQLRYMNDMNPGFYHDQILLFDTFPEMTLDDCRRIRHEALKHPGIEAATLSYYLPTMGQMEYTYRVPEAANTEMLMARQLAVDEHFIETMGLKLLAGRDFRANLAEDINKSIIINETAARVLGWKQPVGRQLDANPSKGPDNFQPVTIVGMVQDIYFESLHHNIQPMVLAPASIRPAKIAVRVQPGSTADALAFLRKLWKQNFPQFPFVYHFLNENFEKMYDNEIRLGQLFTFFTGLAIIISCIGLLALIVYATERRTREISIRKVLGASTASLLYLLSRDYLRLVLVANLLAWPLAIWALLRWLDNFAYRAPFPWWLYPVAGLIALLLALATASLITWKTCRLNPAETLRDE